MLRRIVECAGLRALCTSSLWWSSTASSAHTVCGRGIISWASGGGECTGSDASICWAHMWHARMHPWMHPWPCVRHLHLVMHEREWRPQIESEQVREAPQAEGVRARCLVCVPNSRATVVSQSHWQALCILLGCLTDTRQVRSGSGVRTVCGRTASLGWLIVCLLCV